MSGENTALHAAAMTMARFWLWVKMEKALPSDLTRDNTASVPCASRSASCSCCEGGAGDDARDEDLELRVASSSSALASWICSVVVSGCLREADETACVESMDL